MSNLSLMLMTGFPQMAVSSPPAGTIAPSACGTHQPKTASTVSPTTERESLGFLLWDTLVYIFCVTSCHYLTFRNSQGCY